MEEARNLTSAAGPATFEFIEVTRRGRLTIISINRPASRNALHNPAHFEMARALDAFAADDDAWVAIIRGEGGKAFCAGQDLTHPLPETLDDLPVSGFGGMTSRFGLAKPVIAAVEGFAFGGGFELALACDIIVASTTARFALPEPKVGVVALAGGIQRITKELGLKRAMHLLLTAATLDAATAHTLGIVNEVTEGDPLEAAIRIAEHILTCSPLSVQATKDAAIAALDMPLRDSVREVWTREKVRVAMTSLDAEEGRRSFVEKRLPQWAGK
ncbi:enoyl-CoA hydratase [Sphingobium sp. TA15]|uniref:Putative enoyl-CoA hydratase n=1 Tax=Sphingobium indicum (strain DSM 16413 / CCM 7287 / MTCC 6362 / UT26 / NBRC 101211 / UT26S) TaxID=452662 RepID=D4Z0U6_SPHIU|nr:enoyl-CoA hydratase-related protein [Sphingobium indicum]BAI96228.1 putative enoyl-CoA hydratase [Sphingobium indicum UT26S]BDD65528.1 enoyl-CoA hydratase [Sphingobium sp. TA15]